MSGFWGYGSDGHAAFFERKYNELIDTVHGQGEHIDPLIMPVIKYAMVNHGAVSVFSCEGHPDRNLNKGYITWIFKDAATHIAFLAILNQAQTWMRLHNEKAHLMFDVDANPLYHDTNTYDTMGMHALTLRTMAFHNERIKARWWTDLLDAITTVTNHTKGF